MDLVEANKRKYDDSISSRHPWESARLNVVKKIISKYAPLQKGSVVLDIGCGDTFVVESIASDYPDVFFYAIDTAFTSDLMKKYKEKMKVNNVFLYRSLDEFSVASGRAASLVILTDVIEHIEDDKKFISGLLQTGFISASTLFIITVPSYQWLFCSHDIFLGHYRRYTNALLKENLSQSGLSIIRMGYFFFSLIPVRMFQVLKEKIFRPDPKNMSTGLSEWNGNALLSSAFKYLLIADAGFSFFLKKIGISLPGLSNYAVCRKQV